MKSLNKDKDFQKRRKRQKQYVMFSLMDSTKYHYILSICTKFIKKHMKMDHDIKNLEKIAKKNNMIFL